MKFTNSEWFRAGRWMGVFLIGIAWAALAHAQAVSTTTVQGTVYLANGQPGTGTLQLSWPAFTTAGNQAIAAGRTTVAIGADGFVSVNLAPNLGSTPAGLFYTAVYYMSDGTTSTEYWVVPAAAQATIAQVRAQVMPAAQAMQTASKAYVDQAVQNLAQSALTASGGTLSGPLYLSGDPTQPLQAADKRYVDTTLSQAGNGIVNAGTTGQIAYYSGNGNSVSGISTIPITAGGTGATTATSALSSLGGASLTSTSPQSFAGPLSAPSIAASVNSTINVQAPPYNAKGDCVTDDSAAIQAALNDAVAGATPRLVMFPTPPGGCYLTSTLTWTGASIWGAPPVSGSSSVVIKGKPGQDIFHFPDPNTVTSARPNPGWSMENLVLEVDDSVNASASFPHRWPGRWASDGAMTSGQATLTTSNAEISCGDIGQAILVKGAGVAGADLSTTISSVTPCWDQASSRTVTLAASASTTVSGALVYISVAGLPATQTMGNCALGADNYDGNSAHWTMSGGPSDCTTSFGMCRSDPRQALFMGRTTPAPFTSLERGNPMAWTQGISSSPVWSLAR